MRAVPALAALVALTIACGGNTPTSPTLPPSLQSVLSGSGLTLLTRGTVRATVDGVRWEATLPLAAVDPTFARTPPLVTLSAGSSGSVLFLSISGPLVVGTHELGGSAFVSFGLSEGFANSWSANPFTAGSTGRLTLTTAMPTRIAGTFSFTAAARPGLTPATRTVTDGTFELSP